jgi:hypothetical protein
MPAFFFVGGHVSFGDRPTTARALAVAATVPLTIPIVYNWRRPAELLA